MSLYNMNNIPFPDNPDLRSAMEKTVKGEPLSLREKMLLGRDSVVTNINGYELKPDHAYRAIKKEMLEIYKEKGYILGLSEDDEYIEYEENGKMYNNNKGVDWYLGGAALRYGDIIIECPAYEEYFTLANDFGAGMAKNPLVRHIKSSGFKNPVPTSLITNVFYTKEINEEETVSHSR